MTVYALPSVSGTGLLYGFTAAASLLSALVLVLLVVVAERRRRKRARVRSLLASLESGLVPQPPSRAAARSIVLELADRLDRDTLRLHLPWCDAVEADARSDLRSSRWVRRTRGLRMLSVLGLSQEVLLPALADPHPRVRAAAACSALCCPTPAVCDDLVTLLSDPSPVVRFAALDTLSRLGEAMLPSLRDHLFAQRPLDLPPPGLDSHPGVPPSPGYAPSRLGPSPLDPPRGAAETWLVAPGTRAVLLPGAESSGLTHTLPRLLRTSRLPDDATRTVLLLLTAAGFAARPDETLLDLVAGLGADARPQVRAEALRATRMLLGSSPPPPRSRERVLSGLSDVDGAVRAAALGAAECLGPLALAPAALALSDRDHAVRAAAARLLASGGALGRLHLEAALDGSDRFAAAAARTALSESEERPLPLLSAPLPGSERPR